MNIGHLSIQGQMDMIIFSILKDMLQLSTIPINLRIPYSRTGKPANKSIPELELYRL